MRFCGLVLLLLTGSVSARTGAVNGFVRDKSSGEALAYANVELKGTGLGTGTNSQGYFYIGGVPAGEYQLVVSYIGFGSFRRQIRVREDSLITVNVELSPEPVAVGEVQVTAERARFERDVQVSVQRLETRQLVQVPKLGGEADIIRVVQLLPGVITVSDFSNKLYIRGGSPDQNLILLDGIKVYNPSHLFGIFSPFISEAVSDVTLFAGGFPAQFGSRLSSVLAVNTREGNSRRYAGEGSVSMIAAKALAEGPVPSGSFLVAGRRTYLPDVLLRLFGVPGLNYYFYDLMGKVNYHFNESHRLSLSGLGAEDVLSFWDPGNPGAFRTRLSWGNRGAAVRLNSIYHPVFYGDVLAVWSNFFSDFVVKLEGSDDIKMSTGLTALNLKGDFTWYPHDRHTVGFGLDLEKDEMGLKVEFDRPQFERGETLFPLAVYFDDKWEVIGRRLFLRPGLRLAWYSSGNRLEPEPRLGVKWLMTQNTGFNLAVGRFTQPLVTLNSTEAIFSIYDVWVPVSAVQPIPGSWHYITGVEHWFNDNLTVQVDGYYKDYQHLLETRYGELFTPPDSLLAASGFSCGLELLVRKSSGRLNGWLAYSYMWTERSAGGERYHPHYDRRHNINLVVNLPQLLLGFDLNARFTLGTGLPYTGIAGYYHRIVEGPGGKSQEGVEFVYGDRDAFRYPVYHRLDMGLSRSGSVGRFEVGVFLDVINVDNARNVLLYYWDVESDGRVKRHQVNMLPILPTLGIRVRF
ncbi:MAG: TonB-dependent receptor [candidate division WOR-3 bacterium]